MVQKAKFIYQLKLMLIIGIILLLPIEGQTKLHFGVISLVKEKIDELKGSISGKVVVKSYSYNEAAVFMGTLTLTNLGGIRVILYSNGKVVKSTTVVGNSYKFTGVAPGEYTVKAKVTDEIWNTNESLTIKVTSGETIAGPVLIFDREYGTQTLSSAVNKQLAVDLSNIFCYPNPTTFGEVIFAHLPEQVTIRIFNLKGEKVFEAEKADETSKWVWNCRDSLGNDVPSGVYFYKCTDPYNHYLISNLIIERE
jgi:hypothetical protein